MVPTILQKLKHYQGQYDNGLAKKIDLDKF
jgi:hypothetical protein